VTPGVRQIIRVDVLAAGAGSSVSRSLQNGRFLFLLSIFLAARYFVGPSPERE